ncbi:MAG: cob(I)yrinic acid a,c-diamide adenosyltransferase, partial [Candidatus Thorarchaeota archaeon]
MAKCKGRPARHQEWASAWQASCRSCVEVERRIEVTGGKPEVQGQVQVLTGNGKGKTTCALGAGLRAAGHGLEVLMICFMKAKVAWR